MSETSPNPERGEDVVKAEENEEQSLRGAVRSIESGAARVTTLPERLQHLPERERAQRLDLQKNFADQEHDLRERYANGILMILALQMLVADGTFVAFAWVGEQWELSAGVIEVWLAATVVQVVGIVAIVTLHLFPNRDGQTIGP